MRFFLVKLILVVAFSSFIFVEPNFGQRPTTKENKYEHACPRSAVIGTDASGRLNGELVFYARNKQQINSLGNTINRISPNWGYIKIKNENIPALKNDGYLDYNSPFSASYLLYYNSSNNIWPTWWIYEHNNLSKQIVTFHDPDYIKHYKLGDWSEAIRRHNFNLKARNDVISTLNAKDFVIAEYANAIRNRGDFIYTNTLFIQEGLITSASDYQRVCNFYSGFLSKFENFSGEVLNNRLYITTVKGSNTNFIAIFGIQNGKLVGELKKVNNSTRTSIVNEIDQNFRQLGSEGAAYVYGDDIFGLSRNISNAATENNIVLINRNTSIKKTFNQTENTLIRLKDKQLDKSTTSFVNGFPKTAEEAKIQKIPLSVDGLKKAVADIDGVASTKASKVITTKEELILELTEGENDLLFIVAHCDERYIYFGSSTISIEELNALPVRQVRDKERVAILLSCLTGNIYETQRAFFSFMQKKLKSFSEILLEKNFVDGVFSPPTTIKVGEAVKMIEELDKHEILSLRKYLNVWIINGEIYFLAKTWTQHEKFLD